MKRSRSLIVFLLFASGCTGKREKKLESVAEEQEALSMRLDVIERQQGDLLERLAPATDTGRGRTAAEAAPDAPPALPELPAGLAEALADKINALVQETVELTIDSRIENRIGSADDIEAIFSQVLEEEIAEKEEADRREREAQRRRQAAEWDTRGIERRLEAANVADESRQAVLAAREAMRERLQETLPELKAREAGVEDMLAAVAESRRVYEEELAEHMSEEELHAYNQADWWSRRQQRRVDEIAVAVELDDEQKAQVDQAYDAMGDRIGDGFILMSEGYLDGGVAQRGAYELREGFTTELRSIMTPEQFEKYEASDAAAGGGPGRGRRRW